MIKLFLKLEKSFNLLLSKRSSTNKLFLQYLIVQDLTLILSTILNITPLIQSSWTALKSIKTMFYVLLSFRDASKRNPFLISSRHTKRNWKFEVISFSRLQNKILFILKEILGNLFRENDILSNKSEHSNLWIFSQQESSL